LEEVDLEEDDLDLEEDEVADEEVEELSLSPVDNSDDLCLTYFLLFFLEEYTNSLGDI